MVSRRGALALTGLGVSTFSLPAAAVAASSVGGVGGDSYTEGALFWFTQLSGSQFGFTWVRDASESAFDYSVTVEVVDSSSAITQPTLTSYEYGPYPSGAAGTGEGGAQQVVFFDPLYGGTRPVYGNVEGTRFRAVFVSDQSPAQVRTIPLASQGGDDAW